MKLPGGQTISELERVHLTALSQTVLDSALASAGLDFEDNIQLASAVSIPQIISSHETKKILIPLRLPLLPRRNGSICSRNHLAGSHVLGIMAVTP